MKLRNTALRSLVGWYLIVPLCFASENSAVPRVSPAQWTVQKSFDGTDTHSSLGDRIEVAIAASNKIKAFSFDTRNSTLEVTIDLGTCNKLIDPADMRSTFARPVESFYRIANDFPELRIIVASLKCSISFEPVEAVVLKIDCQNLRKFPKDFDWRSYPVYVANRYLVDIDRELPLTKHETAVFFTLVMGELFGVGNVIWYPKMLEDRWYDELTAETKRGGFPPERSDSFRPRD